MTWLVLMLLALWYTCLWLKEHALLIGIVFLNVHKIKNAYFMKCPFFLPCFHCMCAYGLILSTTCVLTPFLPFLQHFRFWSLKCFWRRHWRRLGSFINPGRVGPHFPREIPLSSLWSCFLVNDFYGSLFPFSMKHYIAYVRNVYFDV